MKLYPLTAIDFYKADHRRQYPDGTQFVYSNLTARSGNKTNLIKDQWDNKVVFFGLQAFIKSFLIDAWGEEFFKKDKEVVIGAYQKRMDNSLGKGAITTEHIEALHDLGYLPLKIKALPEGIRVPIGVPMLTVVNTHPDFFWLTNYIESALSAELWGACTSATTAYEYRKLFLKYARKTGASIDFVDYQGHDFSFRGKSGIIDAIRSGSAHLLSFKGTDNVAAIDFLEDFYNVDSSETCVGCSVPATEHSVMCAGSKEDEYETFRRLIEDVYPSGVISIVSDTWDFWKVITEYTVLLKEKILKRNGKTVFRPDSGDPVKIICGDPNAPEGTPESRGAVECLWQIFGGDLTDNGYKLLNSHIGLIYGDAITLQRADEILSRLKGKGFASSNIVFGIGSFTYQYVTRDTYGFAMKATNAIINEKHHAIYKDPKTDNGEKKSAKGLLEVIAIDGELTLLESVDLNNENRGCLRVVFKDGKLSNEVSLDSIRSMIRGNKP
jgi:nicotinamide phosphoribosyltransferase